MYDTNVGSVGMVPQCMHPLVLTHMCLTPKINTCHPRVAALQMAKSVELMDYWNAVCMTIVRKIHV